MTVIEMNKMSNNKLLDVSCHGSSRRERGLADLILRSRLEGTIK